MVIELSPAALASITRNASFEEYVPMARLSVTLNGQVTTLSDPGRLRPKGRTTLLWAEYLGFNPNLPYQLDFSDNGRTDQTLVRGCGRCARLVDRVRWRRC